MRRTTPCLIAAAAAAAALPLPTAAAGPLDLTEIPRSAALVVHVDLEACLGSPSVGATLREILAGTSDIQIEGVGELRELDIDIARTLLDVTVVATDPEEEEGIVRLRTTDGIDRLLSQLQDEGILSLSGRRGEWMFGSLDDEGVIATRHTGRTRSILLGESADEMLALIEGERGFAAPAPPPGALAYMAVRGLDRMMTDADVPPGLAAARSAVAWIADLDGGALGANLRVTMTDVDAASSVMAVAQGGLALVRLGEPELRDLADAISVSRDESTLSVSLRLPGELIDAIVEDGPSDLSDLDDLMKLSREAHRRGARAQGGDRDEYRGADRRRGRDRGVDTPRRAGARAKAERAEAEAARAQARLRALEGALRELETKLEELIEADAPEAAIDGLRHAIEELRAEIGELEDVMSASAAATPTAA